VLTSSSRLVPAPEGRGRSAGSGCSRMSRPSAWRPPAPADGRARPADQPLQPPAFPRGARADARRWPAAGRVGLLAIDLDGFKPVNDRFGHQAGDEVLVRLATAVGAVVRRNEMFFRMGGDEFAILVPSATALELAELARRVTGCVAGLRFTLATRRWRSRRASASPSARSRAVAPKGWWGGRPGDVCGEDPGRQPLGVCARRKPRAVAGLSGPGGLESGHVSGCCTIAPGVLTQEVIHGTDGQLCEARPRG
jgi:hypothetical protein